MRFDGDSGGLNGGDMDQDEGTVRAVWVRTAPSVTVIASTTHHFIPPTNFCQHGPIVLPRG